MEKGLKKREKILIFTLAMVVLVYLAVQFAILPVFTRWSDSVHELERLTEEVSALAVDIAFKPSLQEANHAAHELHEQITQYFPLLIPNEEIDPILTNLTLHNGLRPTALRFTSSVGVADTGGGGRQTDSPYVFTIVSVTMNMTGSYDSLVSLLDDVDAKEYIRITSLSFASSRESPESGRITLSFELTFLNG